MSGQADIAVAGLGVMGANLALNLADKGHLVAAYNRTTSVTDEFMAGEAGDLGVLPATSIEEMVAMLSRPRVVLIMVTAGKPVDAVIDSLLDHLEEGDIVIDGGNSLYSDTDRRQALVESRGLLYLGIGVSGGEEGARHGPSIMPGGSRKAWEHVEPMLKSIAAKAPDGKPCCEWIGTGGAGHFVKMVHNGIEYGDMQVIAEAYDLMRRGMGMSPAEMSKVFARWDEGRLRSYLIEITSDILATEFDGQPIVDVILDAAGQKGTGKWTVISSLDLGQPTTLVAEAVYARIVSSDPRGPKTGSRHLSQWSRHARSGHARRRGERPLRLEDHLLCPGVPPDASGLRRIRLGSRPGDDRLDLACRMHHPGGVPGGHHRCLPARSITSRHDRGRLLLECPRGGRDVLA